MNLTHEQIESRREDTQFVLSRFEKSYEKILSKKKYNDLAYKINDIPEYSIRMSMISYRIDHNINDTLWYLKDAQKSVAKMKELQDIIESLNNVKVGEDPSCISPTFLEGLCFISLLNKNIQDIEVVYSIYQSDVINKSGTFPFAQQYTPLIMLGALDQKEEFERSYNIFKDLKKSYYEDGLSLYIDLLSAIVHRDQVKFDELHLKAETAMQNHATDKKWGDDIMTGGHEYNVLAYDYRGTALCCLALLRDMEVKHFSCYYPKEIILA